MDDLGELAAALQPLQQEADVLERFRQEWQAEVRGTASTSTASRGNSAAQVRWAFAPSM